MAGSQQDWDSSFETFNGGSRTGNEIDNKFENVLVTIRSMFDDIIGIDGWLATNGACRLLTKVNAVTSDTSYAVTNTDNYNEIWITPTTGNKTVTMPDPTNALNAYRKIKVVNKGDGTYKVTLNPYSAETFNVMSGNEEWTLSSFELLQSGDWCEFMTDGTNWIKCNAPYWHKISDPTDGTLETKTSGWTADSFTGGLEVTLPIPIGSICAKTPIIQYGTQSSVYSRKSGDTNIPNTPYASNAHHSLVLGADDDMDNYDAWASSDLKIQIAVSSVDTDIIIGYPGSYLQ